MIENENHATFSKDTVDMSVQYKGEHQITLVSVMLERFVQSVELAPDLTCCDMM